MIYKVTKDWFGQRIGLLSAWFLAVSFIHVKESHYIKNDVLVGLIVLLIFHFSCLIVSQKKLKNYLFAGLFVGLAFGVKFYPIISIITVLAAHFIKTVKQKNNFIDKKIILFLEIVLLTIIFQSAPTLIFKSDGLSEFIRIKNIVLYDIKPLTNEPLIITFLFRHLREGMGLLMFLTAMIGLLYSVLKIKQFQYFLLIFFPLFFLFTIDLWASYNLPRHSLVLLPFFIILSSLGVNLAIERLSSSNKIKLLVLVIISLTIMAPTLNRSIKMDRYFAGIDTRHLAKKWVEANIPSGEKIVIEGTLKPYIPGGAAPILLSEDAIQKQTVIAQENGYPGTTLKALSKANQSQLGYDILSSQRLDKELDIVMGVERDLNSSFFYYSQGYNYIVTLNWAHFYKPLDQNFDQDFKLNYQKVAQFKPDIDFTASPHDMEIQYEKLDMIDPFRDEMIVGPSIEIYKKLK
ncbi:glycosyltransferase family 39 protein [Candidatus Daviesbacteria bacterium]|nr:glycosyltransferase family 39 protein [Candidatus Daviesbacteria bacterium]